MKAAQYGNALVVIIRSRPAFHEHDLRVFLSGNKQERHFVRLKASTALFQGRRLGILEGRVLRIVLGEAIGEFLKLFLRSPALGDEPADQIRFAKFRRRRRFLVDSNVELAHLKQALLLFHLGLLAHTGQEMDAMLAEGFQESASSAVLGGGEGVFEMPELALLVVNLRQDLNFKGKDLVALEGHLQFAFLAIEMLVASALKTPAGQNVGAPARLHCGESSMLIRDTAEQNCVVEQDMEHFSGDS